MVDYQEQMIQEENKRWERLGAHAFKGALYQGVSMLLLGLVIMFVVNFTGLAGLVTPMDDTDLDRDTRSNLALHKDYGTGCQYLRTRQGHLYPRMNADGTQVCN